MADQPLTCPSARCEEDALILGVVQAGGRIGYLGEPLSVDAAFVARAQAGRTPERRFRFANRCVEGACRQWTGAGCGVIERTLQQLAVPTPEAVPACGIRPSCRWFSQRGLAACRACSLVVTETRAPEAAEP